jgi:hypothetical protein
MSNKYWNRSFLERHCLIVSHVEWHAHNNKQRENILISHIARLNLIISTMLLYKCFMLRINTEETALPHLVEWLKHWKHFELCYTTHMKRSYIKTQEYSSMYRWLYIAFTYNIKNSQTFNRCCFVWKEILIPHVYMCMYICIQFMYLYGGIHAHIVCRLSLVQKEICFLF